MRKLKPVCRDCGSDDVSVDAFVDWNVATQQWDIIRATYESTTCHNCGDTCKIREVELNDADLAQMGIPNQEGNNASDVHQ